MGHNINSESESILSESNMTNDTDVEIKEDEKPYKCTYGCNLSFRKPSRLERHIRFHTGEIWFMYLQRNYKCTYPDCNKAYTNNCHLKRHMKTHSAMKKMYICPVCSICISNQHNLKRHYNTMHMNYDKFTCKECNLTFVKKYQLEIHMAKHNSVVYKCSECDKSFENLKKFKRHKSHHEKRAEQFRAVYQDILLYTHIKNQHVPVYFFFSVNENKIGAVSLSDYKCTKCNKIFSNKHHVKIHSQIHEEVRSVIPCPYEKCPRSYYFKSNLTHHVRTYHLGEKYECDICKAKIGTKQRLAQHIQNLHMSERKIRVIRKKQTRRNKRKDIGVAKKSAVSKIVGINLPPKVEKLVLKREERIEYLEELKEDQLI
ncbi:hypothetical protein WN51_11047 [Melipona quadrifasciata]|uniref:C2H2-type domain-containing protein n=1 Tax=Melipona quadrifasciata TaxID=166423 RepID=A0A0N0BHT3_9HYME|nr:hypothetical protein WN51_11047 [Melipona quadrifasciata]